MKFRAGMLGLFLIPMLLMAYPSAGAVQAQSPMADITLKVSLEWQPSSKDQVLDTDSAMQCADLTSVDFIGMLKRALDSTSADVYGYSAGQVWISRYELYTNGEHWEDADIRILASADFRPTAYLGGFESVPREITLPNHRKLTLAPGSIFLGRLWNGLTARCGAWNDPAGTQTISHELAHHILALGDGYAVNPNSNKFEYCSSTSADLPAEDVLQRDKHNSLLSYQYTAARLRDSSRPGWGCDFTPQTQLYETADWETANRLYGLSLPSASDPLPVPPEHAEVVLMSSSGPKASSALISRNGPEGPALSYLYQLQDGGKTTRMLDQGSLPYKTPTPWLGVQEDDQAIIITRDWLSGDVYGNVPVALAPRDTNYVKMDPLAWTASLKVSPIVHSQSDPTMVAVQVNGEQCYGRTKGVYMTFCPAGGACYETVFEPISNGTFKHRFDIPVEQQANMASAHGYVYVEDAYGKGKAVTTYQLSGGFGPATAEIHSPLADGGVNVDLQAGSQLELEGPTLLMTQSASACASPLPPGNWQLLQWPTFVLPFIVTPDGAMPWHKGLPKLIATFGYDPSTLGPNPSRPKVFINDPANPTFGWQSARVLAMDPRLGLLTVELQQYSGQGLIYAITK